MSKLEQRIIPAEELEIRAEQDGKIKRISGYGIVYNRETQLYDDLYEVIRPGAASEFLSTNPDVKCCLNHNPERIFGRTKSGTVKLEENSKGVKYTAKPPDAQWARDAIASIERGDIDGSSFTFAVLPQDEKVTKRSDGTYLREIFKLSRIGEMGPVTDPAYLDTTAEARAKEEYETLTASLRAQENADEIAEHQRALDLRRKRLELKEKEVI
jgi:HK97 family phage prohead protease